MRQRYGYWPGYIYSPMSLYNMDLFFTRLWFRYGYMPRYDYLGIYTQGAPPLSVDAIRLALRDSKDASAGLVQLSLRLETVLNDFKAGRVSQDEFASRVDEILSGLRTYSKFIRNDDSLGYLDQRSDQKVDSFSRAKSINDLEVLVTELERTARQIDSGISALSDGDGIQTVSVENLSQPSFRSMSKKLDRLTKTIQKSVNRL